MDAMTDNIGATTGVRKVDELLASTWSQSR